MSGYLTHREIDAALGLFPAEADARWVATDSPAARSLDEPTACGCSPARRTAMPEPRSPRSGTASRRGHRSSVRVAASSMRSSSCAQPRRIANAAHEESDPDAVDPVVSRLVQPDRRGAAGDTGRGHALAKICGTEPFEGYHYCSFGLDPAYVEPLERRASSSARPLPMPESRRSSCRSIRSSSRRRSSHRWAPVHEAGSARCSRPSWRRRPRASSAAYTTPAADSKDTAQAIVGSGSAPQLAGTSGPGRCSTRTVSSPAGVAKVTRPSSSPTSRRSPIPSAP